jgi:prophage regulatory protein
MTKLLSFDDLKARGINYSRSQLYRKAKAGTFPKPIRLGENRSAFHEDEVEAWLQERLAARDAGKAA